MARRSKRGGTSQPCIAGSTTRTQSAVESKDSDDSSSDEEDVRNDKSVVVVVKVGRRATWSRALESVHPHEKTGKVLHIKIETQRVDPAQRSGLRRFLLKLIGALPLVEKVEFSTAHGLTNQGRNARWPIDLVSDMLDEWQRNRANLLWFRLCFLELSGTCEQFMRFAECIKAIKSLKTFNLDKISLLEKMGGPLPAFPGSWLDPVIVSLSTLPNLMHARILGIRDFVVPPTAQEDDKNILLLSSSLSLLCQSKSLCSLCLIHFNLSDDNIHEMAKVLVRNYSLQELDIDCTLEEQGCLALVNLIEAQTALLDLNLCVRCKTDESEEERMVNAVGGGDVPGLTPAQKKTLAFEDDINFRLAAAVRNSKLVNFALFRGRISAKSQDAFRDTISKQTYLESLTLYTGDENLNKALADDPIFKFYSKLNYYGRHHYLLNKNPAGRWRNAKSAKKAALRGVLSKPLPQSKRKRYKVNTTTEYAPDRYNVDTLARVSKDVAALYYFLRAKPNLCERAFLKMNDEESTTRLKRAASVSPSVEPPVKRTRRYRSAKYKSICYT